MFLALVWLKSLPVQHNIAVTSPRHMTHVGAFTSFDPSPAPLHPDDFILFKVAPVLGNLLLDSIGSCSRVCKVVCLERKRAIAYMRRQMLELLIAKLGCLHSKAFTIVLIPRSNYIALEIACSLGVVLDRLWGINASPRTARIFLRFTGKSHVVGGDAENSVLTFADKEDWRISAGSSSVPASTLQACGSFGWQVHRSDSFASA